MFCEGKIKLFDETHPERLVRKDDFIKREIKKKLLRTLYYHNCKEMQCIVIKDNKEPCQFCNEEKWKIYLKIYNTGEEKSSIIERIVEKIKR